MSNLRNNQKSEANVKSNILAVTQKKLCLIDDQKKVCLTDTQKKLHSNPTQKITHNMSSLGSVELPAALLVLSV